MTDGVASASPAVFGDGKNAASWTAAEVAVDARDLTDLRPPAHRDDRYAGRTQREILEPAHELDDWSRPGRQFFQVGIAVPGRIHD